MRANDLQNRARGLVETAALGYTPRRTPGRQRARQPALRSTIMVFRIATLRRACGSAGLLGALLVSACGQAPLLSDISVEPAAITPDMDGHDDVARIRYRIGREALVSIDLIGSDGTVHRFRDAKRRSAGAYEALFGGVIDGRMLPDDRYTLRIRVQARDATGRASASVAPAEAELGLDLRGGDTKPPAILNLSVQPSVFSPNQDGLGDRVAIGYRLDEAAEMRLWLADANGDYVTDILETVASARFAGQPGPHQYDYDAGVDADAPPPPDGEYQIVAEARDRSGNTSRETVGLTIRDGGQPRVTLSGDVDWSQSLIELGQTLSFTVTVENIGATPIRTFGPEPGFVYDNRASFNQPAPAAWLILARRGRPDEPAYRAATGLVAARAADATGSAGPIDLGRLELVAPAQDARTPWLLAPDAGIPPDAGSRVTDPAAGTATASRTPAATDEAGAAGGGRDASADGDAPPICGRLTLDGAALAGAEVYRFLVDGDRGELILSDSEGQFCFGARSLTEASGRSFARSPGAVRLGVEYDEKRGDLPYPFRWQLGPTALLDVCDSDGRRYLCLAAGARRQIQGGIRFSEAPYRRGTTIYLALEHEDVRRIQGPYDPRRITVESP